MRRAIVIVAAAVLSWGCGPDNTGVTVSDYQAQRQAAAQRMGKPKASVAKSTEPARPAEADPSSFGAAGKGATYVSAGKRDPFRSFILEQSKNHDIRDRGPLEQFELAQLALQAVVWDTPRPRALVTDPSGRGYIVAEGTPIGKNEGVVMKIADNLVVVRETYVDYLGERTEKDIEMRVRQSQGG